MMSQSLNTAILNATHVLKPYMNDSVFVERTIFCSVIFVLFVSLLRRNKPTRDQKDITRFVQNWKGFINKEQKMIEKFEKVFDHSIAWVEKIDSKGRKYYIDLLTGDKHDDKHDTDFSQRCSDFTNLYLEQQEKITQLTKEVEVLEKQQHSIIKQYKEVLADKEVLENDLDKMENDYDQLQVDKDELKENYDRLLKKMAVDEDDSDEEYEPDSDEDIYESDED